MVNLSLVLCFSFLCLINSIIQSPPVNAKKSPPGETNPTRIEIAVNGSANITCHMNLAKFNGKRNSTSLYFIQEDTGISVSHDQIEILNNSTIVFMLRNATEQDRNYVCKSDNLGIGITHVTVGTAPLDVTDFKCRGYDYIYMVCNFTIPHNVLWTKYNLSYTAHSPNYLQLCQLEIQSPQAICNLTQDRNNYRPNYELYNFTLIGQNSVGTNIQNFWINHYESVIPLRPEYVFERITKNSVVLKWHMVRYSYYSSKGLQYEIRLKPKDFNWMNHSNYEIRNNRSEYKLIIRNLPYAFYWYDVSVRLRVKRSAVRNDESTWSEAFVQKFRTKSCPPDKSPKTDIGSFYIDSSETKVRLYWQQLNVFEENGPDFQYIISNIKRDDQDVQLTPLQIDRSSAVFEWNKHHNYEFTIRSRNAEGISEESSKIFVPAWSKYHQHHNPQWIRNIYHASNLSYTLSWSPPIKSNYLEDYTVFWCHSKQAIPNECRDTIQFQRLPKNVTYFTTISQEQEQSLNMAVSANYNKYNTGMHWTLCTANIGSDLVKLEPELTVLSAHSISVQWSSDRVCSSLLEGYNITYCRISDLPIENSLTDVEKLSCLSELITVTILSTAKKFIINHLQPYSSYKIQMYMFSKLKKGKISEPVIVTTAEDAPSAPRNLKAFNISSNSVTMSWLPPAYHNGKLRKYMIHYNSEYNVIDCEAENVNCKQKEITFTLENLSSFTSYKVYVTAFTTTPSTPSNDVQIKTLIGIPSNPRHMISKENNESILQWSRPEVPSGRVEFYEVAIIIWYRDRIQRQKISRVIGTTECTFRLPECIDADYRHTVQVRAVNVARETEIDYHIFNTNNTDDDVDFEHDYSDNDDLECLSEMFNKTASYDWNFMNDITKNENYVLYKSVWEKGPTYNCSSTKLSRITMWALVVVVSSLGVMATFYVARNKYNKMANISCDLPPGLAAIPYPTKQINDILEYPSQKDAFYTSEHRHLLASISHDSCYTQQSVQGIAACITNDSYDNLHTKLENGKHIDHMEDNVDSRGSGITMESNVIESTPTAEDDPYMIMELLKSHDHISTEKDQLPYTKVNAVMGCNNYIPAELVALQKPISMAENYDIEQLKPQSSSAAVISNSNGYVKLNSIFNNNWVKVPASDGTGGGSEGESDSGGDDDSDNRNSTDYIMLPNEKNAHNDKVTEHMLQQRTADDYTTVESLIKQTQNPHQSTLLPPISGYVTQKELSVFAQKQKFN